MTEIDLGIDVIQLGSIQALGLAWAVAITIAFNVAYYLFLKDRGPNEITCHRKFFTALLGTLIVVGTYADTLASLPEFQMKSLLLLAFVAAHGWMAENLVNSFMANAQEPASDSPTSG